MNHRIMLIPSLATVFAAINNHGCGWMAILNKCKNVAAIFINGHTTTLENQALLMVISGPQSFATVPTAPSDNAVRAPSGDQRTIRRDDNVGGNRWFLKTCCSSTEGSPKKWFKLGFTGIPAKR